jgi:hypothetical protein
MVLILNYPLTDMQCLDDQPLIHLVFTIKKSPKNCSRHDVFSYLINESCRLSYGKVQQKHGFNL